MSGFDDLRIRPGETKGSVKAWRSFVSDATASDSASGQRLLDLQLPGAAPYGPPGPTVGAIRGPMGEFVQELGMATELLDAATTAAEAADTPAGDLAARRVAGLYFSLFWSLADYQPNMAPRLRATGNNVNDDALLRHWMDLNCEGGYGQQVGGVLTGPDGRNYVVTAGGGSEGWNTIGVSPAGNLALGEGLSASDKLMIILGSAVGGGYQFAGWQSLGDNQSRYVRGQPDGGIVLSDGSSAPQVLTRPNAPAPDAPDHGNVPPEIRVSETRWRNRVAAADTAGGAFDIAIGGLNGVGAVQQAEANRNYVSQVVFEENENGLRRASINLYQVQTDGSRVRVEHHNGRIRSDGSVGLVDND